MTPAQRAKRLHLIELRVKWRVRNAARLAKLEELPAESADEAVEVISRDETLDVLPDPD